MYRNKTALKRPTKSIFCVCHLIPLHFGPNENAYNADNDPVVGLGPALTNGDVGFPVAERMLRKMRGVVAVVLVLFVIILVTSCVGGSGCVRCMTRPSLSCVGLYNFY